LILRLQAGCKKNVSRKESKEKVEQFEEWKAEVFQKYLHLELKTLSWTLYIQIFVHVYVYVVI